MTYSTLSNSTASLKPIAQTPATCIACLIESNRLAAEYLAGILGQDQHIDVRLFDEFVSSGSREAPLVFCLDQADAILPLRACLNLLRSSYPESKCILLDTESSNDHMSLLLDSAIHGFIKHTNVKEWLLEAVLSVSRGLLWVHPEFSQNGPSPGRQISEGVRSESLTRREGEILHLVTNHFSNKDISMLLEIEESTVKFHLSNILSKRNVSRREDLATSRISEGWKTLLLQSSGTVNPALRSLLR
jgi:NarL family two-component system response regulator LiaR